MQKFSSAGAPPPDSCASCNWGQIRLQISIILRQQGAPPPDPQNSPPHCEFLATRLMIVLASNTHIDFALSPCLSTTCVNVIKHAGAVKMKPD